MSGRSKRLASGEIQKRRVAGPDALGIQSSAASAVSLTRTMLTFDIPGGRIGRKSFETTKALTLGRAATR
jgi:hypothetical protein